MKFCEIVDGEIVGGIKFAADIPALVRVSGLRNASDEDLRDMGVAKVYPSLNPPAIDTVTQQYDDTPELTYSAATNRVTSTHTIVDKPTAQMREELRAELARVRYEVETAGFEFGGHTWHSDRESQGKYTAAYNMARDAHISQGMSWKTKTGFATLSAEEVQALALTASAHVQAAYAREAQLDQDISAAADASALRAVRQVIRTWEVEFV